MTVCIDTNVLVQARFKHSPHHPIIRACVLGQMIWAVSTSILQEYREVITRLSGASAWQATSSLLDLTELTGNLVCMDSRYEFRVINKDPDDNKFTDCAIAVHADYVITEDKHFAPLANAGYKPQPITPEAFIERYRGVYV
jgi:uncharacterized protein